MIDAGRVFHLLLPPRMQGTGEDVVVIIETLPRPRERHIRIVPKRVMAADPGRRTLDTRIIAIDAGVQKALESRVGHRPVTSQLRFSIDHVDPGLRFSAIDG